ncbi:bifunctional metallophosphatase/5'-nucleotidase [Nocardia sp. NPDC088792]|uniref:bifunctional metallophosphatase/5'-nucleotidase n=1 Tax=Nocardia sp. NPDC088792 TaxID=3364332 RepID=UPI0038168F66
MTARRRVLGLCAALLSLTLAAGCGGSGTSGTPAKTGAVPLISTGDLPKAQPGEVHLFGINDLHGNLQPPDGANGKVGQYTAGGAVYLATHLARLKAAYPDSAIVSAGDNVGASPLISSMFHDEPTIDLLDSLGVAASSVGNHEFDHGVQELRRLQQGGCAADGCSPGAPFTGATFPYLAANVTDANGQLPPGTRPWTMLTVGGHKIGVVGVVTPDTVHIVLPAGIQGYTFGDEPDAIDKYIPAMRAAGAETVVALIHDGGAQQPPNGTPVDYNGCANISPNVTDLAKRTDAAVKVLFTAHSHQAYNCTIDGKVVTQGAAFGRLITDVTLRFHDGTVDAAAVNRVVTRDVTPDPATAKLVDFYAAQVKPRAETVIGNAAAPVPAEPSGSGDSPLGDVIADSMLAAMAPQQAVAAFMNPGGVRAGLHGGNITYSDAYTVEPFGDQVVALTLTGEQILRLLEQQWDSVSEEAGVLSVAGLTYAYSESAPKGHKIIDDTVRIGGQPLNPAAAYRVSTNNFLAAGGDGFTVFQQSKDLRVGPIDLDAFESYLRTRPAVQPPAEPVQKR